MTTGTYSQRSYRWRDDNGNETGADWLAASCTSYTVPADRKVRLRVTIENTNDKDWSNTYQLYYSISGAAYAPITLSSSNIYSTSSSSIADQTATTQQLAYSNAAFTAGEFDSTGTTTNLSVSASTESEFEFCFTISSVFRNFNRGR